MWNGVYQQLPRQESHSQPTSTEVGVHQLMKKQLFLLGVVFISSIWVLFQLDFATFEPARIHRHLLALDDVMFSTCPEEVRKPGFLVNTEGCRIQELDPLDSRIAAYIHGDKPPQCKLFKHGRLVKADPESVYVDWSVVENSTAGSSLHDLDCTFCEFRRVEFQYRTNGSYPRTVDTTSEFLDNCKRIDNRTFIKNEEFIQVDCKVDEKEVYTDFFTFPKTDDENLKLRRPDEVNVLLIGVDAVSRLNLYRQMPKTVQFLKHRVQSIEMLGYNKIGDNTFPNLVAVLSGLTIDELKDICWPSTDDVFDNCPFVWRKYKNAGFHTAFAEDSANIGLFNYLKRGFRKQPTDYYGQIFDLVAERKIGHDYRLNTRLCMGNRMTLEVILEAARNYVIRLKKFLTWGLFWSTSLSHDYLNLPRYGDQSHMEFMETLLSEGVFNSTIVVFLSDHGIRWGGIRETYQGYMEERLPFLFITYPEWFENRYPLAVRNLRTNRRRLTTPFDLYETLIDLIDLRNIEYHMVRKRSKVDEMPRGISLFLPVPEKRTCEEAGVTDNWCTCHTSKPLPKNDSTVQLMSKSLVEHLNRLLKGYKDCSRLTLKTIHSARLEEVTLKDEERIDQQKDYTLIVETIPGNGKFEATVRYSLDTTRVIDPVSRLNIYGNQSRCISHYALKLYCFCKN